MIRFDDRLPVALAANLEAHPRLPRGAIVRAVIERGQARADPRPDIDPEAAPDGRRVPSVKNALAQGLDQLRMSVLPGDQTPD